MKNKTIIITGGTRGIGQQIAFDLLEKGARVAVCARNEEQLKQRKKEFTKQFKGRILVSLADVSKEKQCHAFVKEVIKTYGKIHALVNNAAVPGPTGSLTETCLDDWFHTFDVNVKGAVAMTKAVLPEMISRGRGHIVNVCGACIGWSSTLDQTAYRSSKYALYGFTETIARTLTSHGIYVNALAPGDFDTRLNRDLKARNQLKQTKADKKIGSDQAVNNLCSTIEILLTQTRFSGRLVSAQWDKLADNWVNTPGMGLQKELYRLRRIDNQNYIQHPDIKS